MAAVDQIARRGRESTCANCAHAGGWHEQIASVLRPSASKHTKIGGACSFPGCTCGGYQPGRRPRP